MQKSSTKTASEKILIITADATFGTTSAKTLSDAGYVVSLMKTGVDGLKGLYDILPHLIILDTVLPDGEGYDILQKKQTEPLLAKIPVYLLSTQGEPINMTRVPDGSVAEFIVTLNSSPADILARVNRQFGHTVPDAVQPTVVPTGKEKIILWVEDDKLIGNILGKKLMSSGFNLVHARNGEEALKELQRVTPDVVVVDLLLPGMSGFDILQNIRADEKFKNTPMMVLSNLSKPSDIEKAQALGAKKFLVKAAVSLDEIIKEVKDMSA